jgi:hypothetical protein
MAGIERMSYALISHVHYEKILPQTDTGHLRRPLGLGGHFV